MDYSADRSDQRTVESTIALCVSQRGFGKLVFLGKYQVGAVHSVSQGAASTAVMDRMVTKLVTGITQSELTLHRRSLLSPRCLFWKALESGANSSHLRISRAEYTAPIGSTRLSVINGSERVACYPVSEPMSGRNSTVLLWRHSL